MEEVGSDSKAADSKEADAISCPQDMRCASACVRAGVCARMRLVLQCGRRGPEKSQNKQRKKPATTRALKSFKNIKICQTKGDLESQTPPEPHASISLWCSGRCIPLRHAALDWRKISVLQRLCNNRPQVHTPNIQTNTLSMELYLLCAMHPRYQLKCMRYILCTRAM